VSYRGGVLHENVKGKIPTQATKNGIYKRSFYDALVARQWKHLQNVMIVGHYHFSDDKPEWNYWSRGTN
jgi:hypothetical protein